MKLSKAINYIEKTDSYKFQIESQLTLQRGGLIKRMADSSIGLSTIGNYYFEYYYNLLKDYYEKMDYSCIKTSDPEGFLSSGVKSFKHLRQGVYSDCVEKNPHYFSLNGLIAPPVVTEFKSVYYFSGDENPKDFADLAVKEFVGEFGINEDSFKRVRDENSYKIVYEIESGQELFYYCDKCKENLAYNRGTGDIIKNPKFTDEAQVNVEEAVHVFTPQCKTVDQVSSFLECTSADIAKTIIVEVMGGYFAAMVRGDRDLSMDKLSRVISRNKSLINLADKEKFASIYNIEAGYIGPIGLPSDIKIIADKDLFVDKGFVVGGNISNHHYKNCLLGRDFKPSWISDISVDEVVDNYKCHICGSSDNSAKRSVALVEFIFGEADGIVSKHRASYMDENGKDKKAGFLSSKVNIEPLMGCIYDYYFKNHNGLYDSDQAPFNISLIVANSKDEVQSQLGDKLYEDLKDKGFRVVYNDMDQRAGAKFALDDLLGSPMRITIGKNAVNGLAEIKDKTTVDTKEVPLTDLISELNI